MPALSEAQRVIADDFIKHWHEVLPKRYGIAERFNHTYPLKSLPPDGRPRTLELGAGIGGHLAFEPLDRQDYHCIELREVMAVEIRRRYPSVTAVTGDCQEHLPYPDDHFDRIVVIHVLEHLPDLPKAIAEAHRVLKLGGLFSVVLPCDPGTLYEFARRISAERIFKKRYHLPYGWFIRREHINSPAEITAIVERQFTVIDRSYYPSLVPVNDLNLCIGLTARKPA
ncbi:MAG: class I SAM-dependent methyltransferase [bacterium]|nr:class I SAM-dependent methyltransferase [bacterium]